MNDASSLPRGGTPVTDGILKVAVMAVGGQGGGVLAGWIETLARSQGWSCQTTSVAGVAKRTGATIYYLEMAEGTRFQVLAPAQAGDRGSTARTPARPGAVWWRSAVPPEPGSVREDRALTHSTPRRHPVVGLRPPPPESDAEAVDHDMQ